MDLVWDARGTLLTWMYFGVLLPTVMLVTCIVSCWRRYGRKDFTLWRSDARQLLVFVLIIEVVTYRWLFGNKFYGIVATNPAWRLEYRFPNRQRIIDPHAIERISFKWVEGSVGYVMLQMKSGRRYYSAPAHDDDQAARIKQLKALLPKAG